MFEQVAVVGANSDQLEPWTVGDLGQINYNRFGFGSAVKFGDVLDGQAYIHMLRSCRSLEMQMRRR